MWPVGRPSASPSPGKVRNDVVPFCFLGGIFVCFLNCWLVFPWLYSRICVCLGDGHKPAAWYRWGGWWVEPCEDDWKAVGKPCSTNGVQRGAAYGPIGQRRAGELISASGWEGQGHFIGWGFGLVCDVDGWWWVWRMSEPLFSSEMGRIFSFYVGTFSSSSGESRCTFYRSWQRLFFLKKSYFWHFPGAAFTD